MREKERSEPETSVIVCHPAPRHLADSHLAECHSVDTVT